VIKRALTQNPTLFIDSFYGSDEAKHLLQSTLTFCDWFEILKENTKADYYITGTYQESSNEKSLKIQISSSDYNPITRFEQKTEKDNPTGRLIYSAVDEIIWRIFKAPGFCSTSLAYVKNWQGKKEIWTADFDGSNAYQLTRNNGISVEPDWGNGNRFLVYTYYNNYSTDIIMVDMIKKIHKRVTRFPGLNSSASIAHHSLSAAMTLSKDGNVDLYVMNMNTGNLQRLTNSEGAESSPSWSPDDKQLCYVSDDVGNRPMIYIIPSTGGSPKRLLRIPVESVSPNWSKTSNKICFSMSTGNQYTVAYVDMNTNDRDPEILINIAGDWESPYWAADGRHIVCSRNFEGKQRLYLIDSFYKKVIPFKSFEGKDSLPSYSDLNN
jgi:TolB protein